MYVIFFFFFSLCVCVYVCVCVCVCVCERETHWDNLIFKKVYTNYKNIQILMGELNYGVNTYFLIYFRCPYLDVHIYYPINNPVLHLNPGDSPTMSMYFNSSLLWQDYTGRWPGILQLDFAPLVLHRGFIISDVAKLLPNCLPANSWVYQSTKSLLSTAEPASKHALLIYIENC